ARRTAAVAGAERALALVGLGLEALGGPGEEAEVEGVLGARRHGFERVERLLVPQVPVARRHWALLHDVVDAPEDAVRRGLALAQPDQRLDLAREPRRRRQHRGL